MHSKVSQVPAFGIDGFSRAVLSASAKEISLKVCEGQWSAVSVLKVHLGVIHALNPSVNAIVILCEEEALQQAHLLDGQIEEMTKVRKLSVEEIRKKIPLAGVPFTVKEMIAVKGKPHTLSSYGYRNRIAKQDAVVVERVKEKGAIFVGLTNQPELAFWIETKNLLYGRTNNPHDINRTPGGSSGGEGAAVASGMVVFGIGSDAAGSIRLPAALCGVYGHKATAHTVPLEGHIPLDIPTAIGFRLRPELSQLLDYVTLGPLCRKAEDLDLLYSIFRGKEWSFPKERRKEISTERPDRQSFKKIYTLANPKIRFSLPPTFLVQAGVHGLARELKKQGFAVEPLDIKGKERNFSKGFQSAVGIWLSAFGDSPQKSAGKKGFLKASRQTLPSVLKGEETRSWKLKTEWARTLLGKSRHTLPTLLFATFEGVWPNKKREKQMMALASQFGKELSDFLEKEQAVLLMPVAPTLAKRHRLQMLSPFDWSYTGIFNILGLPSTAIPVGRAPNRLPISVQCVAPKGKDHWCFEVAQRSEKSLGGWVRPRKLEQVLGLGLEQRFYRTSPSEKQKNSYRKQTDTQTYPNSERT